MDKRSQKKARESATGQFSSKTRVDASPAKTTCPPDAPEWAYKAGSAAERHDHGVQEGLGHEEDYLEDGSDEESHCNEPESAAQVTQSSQHCTPSGAGATTDSRRRITFNLESFLSSEADDSLSD